MVRIRPDESGSTDQRTDIAARGIETREGSVGKVGAGDVGRPIAPRAPDPCLSAASPITAVIALEDVATFLRRTLYDANRFERILWLVHAKSHVTRVRRNSEYGGAFFNTLERPRVRFAYSM
jgi:hypothetical protein